MNDSIDYKHLYLKYRGKYDSLKLDLAAQELEKYNNGSYSKNKIGGSNSFTVIPKQEQGQGQGQEKEQEKEQEFESKSYIIMPLIYYVIDKESVEFPEGFKNTFEESIKDTEKIIGQVPYSELDSICVYLKYILESNGIKSLADIELIKDEPYHIPELKQLIIINYMYDEFISTFIGCLEKNLIKNHSGKRIVYLK